MAPTFAVQDCGLELHDTELLGALKRAERCEEFATTMSGKLHPYHFKIFHMYLKHLDQVGPTRNGYAEGCRWVAFGAECWQFCLVSFDVRM